jgi:hypothetical protein
MPRQIRDTFNPQEPNRTYSTKPPRNPTGPTPATRRSSAEPDAGGMAKAWATAGDAWDSTAVPGGSRERCEELAACQRASEERRRPFEGLRLVLVPDPANGQAGQDSEFAVPLR